MCCLLLMLSLERKIVELGVRSICSNFSIVTNYLCGLGQAIYLEFQLKCRDVKIEMVNLLSRFAT